jgi:large subunit ribosomal protein L27
MGKDHTLFALIDGTVMFQKKRKNRSYISVEPVADVDVAVAEAPAPAEVAEEKPKAEPAKAEKVAAEVKEEVSETETDDLKKIEGVGPKLAEVLNAAGINTYAELAAASVEKMNEILEEAGSRYASKDPAPWIEQAKELAGK